jgi:TolC family type I secretion outer membrane protein
VLPDLPPQSTAAPTVAVVEAPATPSQRVRPVYGPDNGGPLSGLPFDRKDPIAPVPAPVRTLAEAITRAYRTNPQLLAARATARAADFRIPEARSAYGPTLSANAAYTFTRTRTEVLPRTFVGAQGWTSTASLVLNQPIFTFGRNAAAEAGAVATSEYQRNALRVTEAEVIDGVVEVYVSVLRDAQAVTIARENLALLERQLEDNQRRYEVRDLTQTDLDQTRTRVEFGRAELVQALGQLGVSQKRFLQFVGAPPGELGAPDVLDVPFGSLAAAYAFAEANSGLVRAAQAREKISRAAVSAARAERGPRLDLRGTADYGSVSSYSDDLRASQLIGQVVFSQPLVDSGLRRARQAGAQETNQADWRLLDSALRDTREAIGSAWDQLAATRGSLTGYRDAIAAAERAYQGALLQQRAGDRSTLDVLDLARDLLTLRTSYNNAVANEYLLRSGLLRFAGLLEGPLVLRDLAPYDADEHYRTVRDAADVPLVTSVLGKLDSIGNGGLRSDRESRDSGAEQAMAEAVPMPPAPEAP